MSKTFSVSLRPLSLSLLPSCPLSGFLSPFAGSGSLHRRGRVSSLRWFTTWDEWPRPSSLHDFFPFPLPPCTIIIPFRLASFRRLLLLLPVCLFFRALDVYAYVYVYDVARLGLCACITCCPLCIVPPTVSLSVSVFVPSCMLSSRPCMTEPSA